MTTKPWRSQKTRAAGLQHLHLEALACMPRQDIAHQLGAKALPLQGGLDIDQVRLRPAGSTPMRKPAIRTPSREDQQKPLSTRLLPAESITCRSPEPPTMRIQLSEIRLAVAPFFNP